MVRARPLAGFLPEAARGNELSRPPADLAFRIVLAEAVPVPDAGAVIFIVISKFYLGPKTL
jgi:hypothetical protein